MRRGVCTGGGCLCGVKGPVLEPNGRGSGRACVTLSLGSYLSSGGCAPWCEKGCLTGRSGY